MHNAIIGLIPGDASSTIGSLVSLAISIVVIAGAWKMFQKAGKPGWASIVPIYNMIVALDIAGKPAWWVLLGFIPVVGLVVGVIAAISIAQNFGKSALFGVGLAIPPISAIMIVLLGFGDAQYRPIAQSSARAA